MIRLRSPRRTLARRRCRAFTLIELLTVIAIILVLAGLLLHIAGSANYKGSMARAQAEIQAMSTALESYKADNGTYPRVMPTNSNGTAYSDLLNAQTDTDPGGNPKANYQGASEILYQALSGITAFSGTNATYGGKPYMEFKPGQLSDASSGAFTTPSATTILVDPFGLPYGYSTINLAAQDAYNTSGTAVPSTAGYNPTFDLWSTGGYGTGGKPYTNTGLTAPTATNNTYAPLWAKNW